MTHPWPYPLPQAFFLPADGGQRFCLFYPPEGTQSRGRVLYLHPFAEELNSTRRIVAQQARALAQAGHGVLLVDPQHAMCTSPTRSIHPHFVYEFFGQVVVFSARNSSGTAAVL